MTSYRIEFKTDPYKELDQFALLACQKYNFGNDPDWFGEFRGGLYGFYARLFGVSLHFTKMHEWGVDIANGIQGIEYHLASLFFNMDSAIECLTYSVNALGFGYRSESFWDVTSTSALKK